MVVATRDNGIMRLPRLRSVRSKKALVVIISVMLALIAGGYILWSKQVWAQYTPSHAQWHQDIKSEVKALTGLPTGDSKEEDALLLRMEKVSQRITSEQVSACDVSVLVKWQQQFIKEYDDMRMACQKTTADIALFQKQLAIAIDYIKDDQELAKIITTTVPSDELAEGVWEKQVVTWNEAVDATTNLSVSSAFKSTQQRAIERMAAVKVAWQELIAAHQLKDKAKYVAAQDKLGISYDGLNDISTDSEKNLAGIADGLRSAYEESFQ